MFPLAALLDVGNSNMARVELMWSSVTAHLGEVRTRGGRRVGRRRERERERERE